MGHTLQRLPLDPASWDNVAAVDAAVKAASAAAGAVCGACKQAAGFACRRCGAAAPGDRRYRLAFQCEHGLWTALLGG